MMERFEKTHAFQRRPTKIFLIIGVVVLLMLVLINLLTRIKPIQIFPLNTVIIEGNKLLTTDDILTITGISSDQSLLTIRKQNILKKLYKDKRIASAEVIKIYPDKIKVLISEVPGKILIKKENELYISSSNGIILKKLNNSILKHDNYADFIEITLYKKNVDIKEGDYVTDHLLREAIISFYNLERTYPQLSRTIQDIIVEDQGITVVMNSKVEPVKQVYLGFTVDEVKLDKLRAVLLVARKIYRGNSSSIYIDLSSSYAAVKLKES